MTMSNHIKEFHPVTEIFPMMDGEQFAKLVEDIKANGLREPIWLHSDGRIVDGRNRYGACLEAGVEPRFINVVDNEESLVAFGAGEDGRKLCSTTSSSAGKTKLFNKPTTPSSRACERPRGNSHASASLDHQ